jgi:hypothetical protein
MRISLAAGSAITAPRRPVLRGSGEEPELSGEIQASWAIGSGHQA